MRIIHALAVPAAFAFALPALAQTAPATPAPAAPARVQYTRVQGELVSLSAKDVVVRAADGKTTSFVLTPTSQFFVSAQMPASAIKPGDFVATTNVNIDDHSGRATELRVYPASAAVGGQASSYPMAAPNTTMTNAAVAEVTDNADGRVIKVKYPGGERQILLPSTVKVIGQTALDRSAFKPGWHVVVIARPDASGALAVTNLQTGANGAPPPAR